MTTTPGRKRACAALAGAIALTLCAGGVTAPRTAHAGGPAGASAASARSAAGVSAAPACSATSPAHRVALVELFTSEGCSSCPPADRWLSSLESSGFGLDRVVALSLHVGYWDYIGWKDPYARPAFTDRQRAYARVRGSGTIYTPQVVLDGRDYRAWHSGTGFRRDVDAITAQPAPFRLRVDARAEAGAVAVSLHGVDAIPADAILTVAVFEDRLSNRVTRGENRGASLTHDRVVRGWSGALAATAGQRMLTTRIELPADVVGANAGVAAFVQSREGTALQALACRMRVPPG
ncbi:MAG: DUF1223 domain-containing protein [Burkholderiaceae bacterium]|nr:DUF1223 domain-containing protein [Burkholderiaceae bacterium]